MNLKQLIISFALIAGLGFTLPSCESQAKKDIEAQAQIEATLSRGATIKVDQGVATLGGTFRNEAARESALASVKATPGVKSVVDNSTIEAPIPVEINNDQILTTAVNSVLSSFSGVAAEIHDGVVTLNGEIAKSDLPKLMQEINALHPKKVDNKLVIKN